MRYTAIIVSLAIGAFALPQDASTITSAPASAASAGLTPQVSCALACDASDVNCQASCLGAAHPNSSQVVETTECAEKCDQGDGTPEDTEKYSECVQSCIASFFPTSQTVAVGAASSAAASLTGSAASAASSAASRASSGTGSPTGSAAAASGTGAANINSVQVAGAGVVGLVMAIFAL